MYFNKSEEKVIAVFENSEEVTSDHWLETSQEKRP